MKQGGWPNWYGEAVAIIASGASAKRANLDLLRGHTKVIAIKENVDLCPWADAVYGCDAAWWQFRKGLPEYPGLKICWSGGLAGFPDIRRVEIVKNAQEIIFGPPGKIGSGLNSGFQALNIAVQFGAARVLLVGYDMHDRAGVHWYGRNTWPMANNPDGNAFRRWLPAFDKAAVQLRNIGVEVINTSPNSDLKAFRHRSLEDAISET